MHLDNLLFILLIAVAALFRLLASKAGDSARKKSEPPPQRSTSIPRTDQPPPLPPADNDEERIRRFLEALGQPTSSQPPPRVTPRTDIPPRPVAPIQPPREMRPFPSPTLPREERRRKITPRPVVAPVLEPKTLIPAVREAPVFEVQQSALATEQPPALATVTSLPAQEVQTAEDQPGLNITTLLSSPSGLRDAIVLREIFGPPRSLQPLHLIGDA